jgi:tetratricopeptide (TPR) repeat protein
MSGGLTLHQTKQQLSHETRGMPMSDEKTEKAKKVKIPEKIGQRLLHGEIDLGEFAGLSRSAQYEMARIAHASLESGKPAKALPIYRGLVAASPTDSVFQCHLAATLYALRRLDEAFLHYNNSLRFNPKNIDALTGRGELYLYKKQVKEAAQDFKAAVKADPEAKHLSTLRARTALAMLAKVSEQGDQSGSAGRPRSDAGVSQGMKEGLRTIRSTGS